MAVKTMERPVPAAEPGTEVRVDGRRLVAYGTGFGHGGLSIDPNQVLVVESLRDRLGPRTVLHLANGELVVLAESTTSVGAKLAKVRAAR